MRTWRIAALPLAFVLLLSGPALGAKKRRRHAAKPKVARALKPIYGPPAPVPAALQRAAGSCLSYEAGHFILLAEVGQQGRMFRIGPETVFHIEPRRGARIRLLYEETPDGPVAREVLPGPMPEDD